MAHSNFLVIIFSGISLSLLGLVMIFLPDGASVFVKKHIECFLTLPPISVASYILVFKYHEKFNGQAPSFDGLINTILQGTFAAAFFFFWIAICSSILFRLYFILKN